MKRVKNLLFVVLLAGAVSGTAYAAGGGSPYNPNTDYSWGTSFSCTQTVGNYTSSFSCNNWADAYLAAVVGDTCEGIVGWSHDNGYSCTAN